MILKTLTIVLIFFSFSSVVYSQKIKVERFNLEETDLTANSRATTVIDQNGEKCALIRIQTTDTDFTFEVGSLGVQKTEQRVGEIWVYVPFGVHKITLRHRRLGTLYYDFPISIEKSKTYTMVLSDGDDTLYKYDVTDFYTQIIWNCIKSFNVFDSPLCDNMIGYLNKDTHFEILSAQYFFYDFPEVNITKVLKNDFDECDNPFKIGDKLQLLHAEGECVWDVLYNDSLNFATFCFDLPNKKITESVYDGCHKIEGEILKSTEHKRLVMKVKYDKTNEGWIYIENKGVYDNEYSYMESVCDKELYNPDEWE